MKLTDDNTARTHWTDEDGAEWDIKILFSYQPAERMEPNPDHPMFGPGCDAGIVDMQVERWESYAYVANWVLFDGATEAEEAEWCVEIMEAINQQAMDDRG